MVIIALFASCTKQNFIDTGKANPHFNGTVLSYLKSDNYNWDLTVQMINRAGLNDLFDGRDPANPTITFLGPTKFSILRYMLNNGYATVNDVPVQTCHDLILKLVIKGKYLKADIPKGTPFTPSRSGGKLLPTLGGINVFLYTFTQPLGGVAGAGPTYLYLESEDGSVQQDIASADIQPTNGVVHSLHYNYTLGDIQ